MKSGGTSPLIFQVASLSLTANLELNRYSYPTSPARIGNGIVNHSLFKIQ